MKQGKSELGMCIYKLLPFSLACKEEKLILIKKHTSIVGIIRHSILPMPSSVRSLFAIQYTLYCDKHKFINYPTVVQHSHILFKIHFIFPLHFQAAKKKGNTNNDLFLFSAFNCIQLSLFFKFSFFLSFLFCTFHNLFAA